MVDPNIKKKADDIRNKVYGSEVRESLASGLEEMSSDVVETVNRQDGVEEQFQDVIENTTDKDVISAPEIIAARNGKPNLKRRIDDLENETTAQLAQKANKGDIKQSHLDKNFFGFDASWFTSEFLQELSNNEIITTVLEPESVTRDKLVDGATGLEKVDFVKGANLFTGEYTNINVHNNEIRSPNNLLRTAVVRLRSGRNYRVRTRGKHNRFILWLADSLEFGSLATSILVNPPGDTGGEEFLFTNDASRYLIIVMSYNQSDFNAELEVVDNSELMIGGTTVLKKTKQDIMSEISERRQLFDGNYMNDIALFASNYIISHVSPHSGGKVYILEIEPNAGYEIIKQEKSNRFRIALSHVYPSTTEETYGIEHVLMDDAAEYYYVKNTTYKYLLIQVSASGEEPELEILSDYYLHDDIKVHQPKRSETEAKVENAYYDIYTTDIRNDYPPTTHIEIYNMLDEIVSESEWAHYNIEGLDEWGNEIREYVFSTPQHNDLPNARRTKDPVRSKKKIIATTGLHGDERSPNLAFVNIFRDLCQNNQNSVFKNAREELEFRFIPIASPTAYDNSDRINENGYNVNRNFDTHTWEYLEGWSSASGPSPASEKETQVLQSWMEKHSDAIAYIDVHNTGYPEEVTYLSSTPGSDYEDELKDAYFKMVDKVSKHWKETYELPEETNIGYSGTFGDIATAEMYGHYLGIPSCVLEVSWQLPSDTMRYGKYTNAMSTEAIVNFIIQIYESELMKR